VAAISGIPLIWLGCADVLGIQPLTFPPDAGEAASLRDGGDAGDAFATDWCKTHAADAAVCEDFDEDDALPSPGWNRVVYGAGGDAAFDDDVYVSPPRGLTIDVPAVPSNVAGQWWLWRPDLPALAATGSSTVTLAFDVRLDEPASGSDSYVVLGGFVFDLGSADAGASVELLYDADGLHLVQGFGAALTDFGLSTVPLPSPGTWTRVELDLTLDADDGGVWGTATVGGMKTAFDAGAVVALASLNGHGPPTAGVGNLIALGPSSAQTVHIDDVVVDVQR
jgi:hypothetical protein